MDQTSKKLVFTFQILYNLSHGDLFTTPTLTSQTNIMNMWKLHIRGHGGIGRRARFRSVWAYPRGGSSPLDRILIVY